MHVEPVAILVRSVASGLPAWFVISANAPPPSGSSPAGSLTLHPSGRSKVSWPSAVVYVVQAAAGGVVAPVGLGAPYESDVGVVPGGAAVVVEVTGSVAVP